MKDIDGIEHVLRVLQPHWLQIEDDFNRHNQRFLALSAADHDVIGRVLRAHLVIESFMVSYLAAHYAFENVDELKLSFYQKAMLLPSRGASAAAVRPGILQVNAIRNKFGHRLNHVIESHEISAVFEMLAVARNGVAFASPADAIEAFASVACAFLSVPPQHLQQLFAEAFSQVHSHVPQGAA
jgi:hypothetical protein